MRRELPLDGPILVSACLAGRACAYDGGDRAHEAIMKLVAEGRAVLVCPEDEGGLGTPRPASEIIGGDGADVLAGRAEVRTKEGRDVTGEYIAGARLAVERAAGQGCNAAILKARSPACGCGAIYDGTFSRSISEGDGVAASALKQAGIEVWTEEEL